MINLPKEACKIYSKQKLKEILDKDYQKRDKHDNYQMLRSLRAVNYFKLLKNKLDEKGFDRVMKKLTLKRVKRKEVLFYSGKSFYT